LEVDLIYPYRLHDLHNDLPFCPSNCLASKDDKVKKLVADLENKNKLCNILSEFATMYTELLIIEKYP